MVHVVCACSDGSVYSVLRVCSMYHICMCSVFGVLKINHLHVKNTITKQVIASTSNPV